MTQDEAFRRFLRRVWREDVSPLLRDRRAAQRKKTARVGGKLAASAGLFVDGLFGLKGRPFARFMTVMGSSVGALLPDVWDSRWFATQAEPAEQQAVCDGVQRSAAALADVEALELFGLTPTATREDLKCAWRATLQRWHPDKARSDEERQDYQLRFLAYRAAHERLTAAFDDGRLSGVRNDPV